MSYGLQLTDCFFYRSLLTADCSLPTENPHAHEQRIHSVSQTRDR